MIASGLVSQQTVVLSAADKNFQTLPELTNCLRASMMIPGVAGDVVRLKVLYPFRRYCGVLYFRHLYIRQLDECGVRVCIACVSTLLWTEYASS